MIKIFTLGEENEIDKRRRFQHDKIEKIFNQPISQD